VRFQSGLVAVNLVVIKTIRVVPVLDHIETKTAGLISLRMLCIIANLRQKLRNVLGFHLNGHMQNHHRCTPCNLVENSASSNDRFDYPVALSRDNVQLRILLATSEIGRLRSSAPLSVIRFDISPRLPVISRIGNLLSRKARGEP